MDNEIVTNSNISDFIKQIEKDSVCTTPLKTRMKTNKLLPVIKRLSNEELKALFIVLSSKDAIKATEILHSGRYAAIQKYIISKEIIDRATITKIGKE